MTGRSWPPIELGSDEPRIRFGEEAKAEGTWAGRRLMFVDDRPSFGLSSWCGTCPFLFERLEGSNQTLSVEQILDDGPGDPVAGLEDFAGGVLQAYGDLLERGRYLPVLLEVTPRLVRPSGPDDYFTYEQVATWGLDAFWDLPPSPRTPYYRTFATAIDSQAHLYEFVVPMVPPSWNDRSRVEQFTTRLLEGSAPAAIAVSTLDVCAPAVDSQSADYYDHWGLTHFLLDGHHKVEAAAAAGCGVRLLALVSLEASLATEDQVLRLADLRSRTESAR